MIKSAASAASLDLQGSPRAPSVRKPSRRPWAPLQIQGGCASSRLDHGLKVWLFTEKRLPFPQYLAALAAKFIQKICKNTNKLPLWAFYMATQNMRKTRKTRQNPENMRKTRKTHQNH